MAPENSSHSYHLFDQLLSQGLDPQYLGDQLDEIMFRLVLGAGDDYPSQLLSWHYYLLLILRDIFWALEKVVSPIK